MDLLDVRGISTSFLTLDKGGDEIIYLVLTKATPSPPPRSNHH